MDLWGVNARHSRLWGINWLNGQSTTESTEDIGFLRGRESSAKTPCSLCPLVRNTLGRVDSGGVRWNDGSLPAGCLEAAIRLPVGTPNGQTTWYAQIWWNTSGSPLGSGWKGSLTSASFHLPAASSLSK